MLSDFAQLIYHFVNHVGGDFSWHIVNIICQVLRPETAGICTGTKVQFPTGTEENVNKVIFLATEQMVRY